MESDTRLLHRGRSPLTLLVLDDDQMMLDMLQPHLKETFEAWGARVSGVQTASELFHLIDTARIGPLAVLSDHDLKAASTGVDVLRAVAVVRPAALRVLMSGHAREEITPGVDDPAVDAFIEKPLHIETLVAALRQLMANRFPPGLATVG